MEKLLDTGVVETGWPTEMFWPVVTRMFIIVADLVVKSETFANKPIDFLDDVIVKERVKNVGLLIRYSRDALCHVESSNHMLDKGSYFSFNVSRGQSDFIKIEESAVEIPPSEYADDIAFFFGAQRVYYRRHLLRAFRESAANLEPLIK